MSFEVNYSILTISNIAKDLLFPLFLFRTPLMAKMHEDDSPELTEVGRILREKLEVN